MMYCKNCGEIIKENNNFCTNCGESVDVLNKRLKTNLVSEERWWIRLLRVVHITLYFPLLLLIPIVWNENSEYCYSKYSCRGSVGESFFYSLLTLLAWVIVVRLIKIAVLYIALGKKPYWKGEFKKFF